MMESLSLALLNALVAGAAAAITNVANQTIIDAYNSFKTLVVSKLGQETDVEEAIQQVERRPDSESRQGVLKEELDSAFAAKPHVMQDAELHTAIHSLIALLHQQGDSAVPTGQIMQTGSGAIAIGSHAKAGGKGSVTTDTIYGSVNMGNNSHSVQTESYTER